MDIVIGLILLLIIGLVLYRFAPAFRRKTDEFGRKIDRKTGNEKDGPFR